MTIKRDVRTGHIRLIWFGTGALVGYFQAGWRGAAVGVLIAFLVFLVFLALALWGARREFRGQWPYDK